MKKVYVLDACALIAFLRDEEGAELVGEIYEKANTGEASLIMNKINLVEVYYDFYRSKGKDYADNFFSNIKQSEIVVKDVPDDVLLEAGRLKATYSISLADSFALSQAIISSGELLTADHHEFDIIERQGIESIEFL